MPFKSIVAFPQTISLGLRSRFARRAGQIFIGLVRRLSACRSGPGSNDPIARVCHFAISNKAGGKNRAGDGYSFGVLPRPSTLAWPKQFRLSRASRLADAGGSLDLRRGANHR
jgi:hypothetical protein